MIPFPQFQPCASRRAARGKTFARGWMCFASRLRFHRLFLAVVSLLTIGTVAPSARAGLVFSDDFATDPFASRWTNTAAGGSYLPVWTGNTTPNPTWSAGLPTNANNNSVYSGACTSQSMSTTDTSVPAGSAGWNTMTYSVDFILSGTNVGNSIGVLVNRSGNNGYTAAIYTDGSGNILWAGDYGSTTWAGYNLAAGTWYRFKTTVTKSGADLSLQSRILDLGGNVLATSPTKTFTNAAYTDPHGFQVNFGSDGYWDRARQIDNLRVEVTTLAFIDDFGINPLLAPNPRWNATVQTNSYPVLWTGLLDLGDTNVFGGNGVSLPTNANPHCLYAFSDGWRTFSTISTTNPVSGWTTQSYQIDFRLGGTASTLSGMSLAVVVNRSGTNGYRSAFSIGSSDRVKWIGSYGSTSLSTPALAKEVWYRLITEVARAGSTNTMQARIVRVSDGVVLHSSPLYADSTGQYPDPNGFLLENDNGTGTGFYWSRAMQLDNFQVFSDVPAPAWLDNSLGKDNNVPAPWTAVTVSNHTVNVWGRSYQFNELGLPAALISQGQDLFGGTAMLVNALVDGQALTFNATNALQFDTTRADQVVVTATAAANVSGVMLVVTNTIEFDGFVRSRIYLSGSGSNTLNQFWLDTSLASAHASYSLPQMGNPAAIPPQGLKRPLHGPWDFVNFTPPGNVLGRR